MSHKSILVSFCTDAEVNALKLEQEQLKNILQTSKIAQMYRQQFADVINEFQIHIEKLRSLNVKEKLMNDYTASQSLAEWKRTADSIMKLSANLKTTMSLSEMATEAFQSQSQELAGVLKEFGTLAIDALYSLNKKNIEGSADNIRDEIENIRNNSLNDEEVNSYRSHFREAISKLKMPDEFKVAFINEVMMIHSSQEFADFAAYLETKTVEFTKTIDMVNQFVKSAGNKLGFGRVGTVWKVIKDEEHIDDLRVVIKLKNNKGNIIDYSFSLKGTVEYQMGNYEGHMCDADAEVLMKDLNERGYVFKTVSITRNVSNAKPLQQTAKQNTKEKE